MYICGKAVMIITAFLMVSCVSSAPITVEKKELEYEVIANSLLLNNHIHVIECSARLMNNLLEVQVRGQNITNKDIQFEYRFIWMDEDGIKINTQMSIWKPLSLHAKEIAFMSGIAPTPSATDFLMAVRFVQQTSRW